MDNRTTIMIVPINITSTSNISAVDINIMYNVSVLNVTNVEDGTLIDALGENVSVEINAQEGSATEIAMWYAGDWQTYQLDYPFNNFDVAKDQDYFVKCDGTRTWTPVQFEEIKK